MRCAFGSTSTPNAVTALAFADVGSRARAKDESGTGIIRNLSALPRSRIRYHSALPPIDLAQSAFLREDALTQPLRAGAQRTINRMTDIKERGQHGMLKFECTARREKVAAILSLTAVACIVLGLGWALCYWYFDRAELSGLFLGVMVVGVMALVRSKRSDGRSILLVAHGILIAVCAIALIDAPTEWVPRSAHMFLLPLAAGAAFTFEARERYGSLVFPLICLAAFAAFAAGALDSLAPRTSPPLEVREWGARSNIIVAIVLLAAIFKIYRADVGKRLRLERELGRAVRNGEIELHYQPQVRGDGRSPAWKRWRAGGTRQGRCCHPMCSFRWPRKAP